MSEAPLSVPPKAEQGTTNEARWTVVAHNERVNRAWQDLIKTAGENAGKCGCEQESVMDVSFVGI